MRPSNKVLVKYSKKTTKNKIYRNNSQKIKAVNYSLYYNADKAIENVNNHTNIHPPNFSLMSSRPNDNDPLPSYMKKIVDRFGLSEFSLNMNNYKNRDFSSMGTTFLSKRSFNKLINLNLLNSKNLLRNVIFDGIKKNPLISKILRFYSKKFRNSFA